MRVSGAYHGLRGPSVSNVKSFLLVREREGGAS